MGARSQEGSFKNQTKEQGSSYCSCQARTAGADHAQVAVPTDVQALLERVLQQHYEILGRALLLA